MTENSDLTQLSDWIDKIERCLNDNDLPGAQAYSSSFKVQDPTNSIADYFMALVSLKSANYTVALASVDACLSTLHQSPDPHQNALLKARCARGHILWKLDRKIEAKELLTHVGEQYRCPEAFIGLASLWLEDEQPSKVLETYVQGIACCPTSETLWFLQAQAQSLYLSDVSVAFRSLDSILGINPNHRGALRLRTRLELKNHNFVGAMACANQLLSLDPSDDVGLSANFYGSLYLGQWDLARSIMPLLCEACPDLASQYQAAFDEAISVAENPGFDFDKKALFTSGLLSARQGDFAKALNLFKTAEYLDSKYDPHLILWIASCLAQLDREAEAIPYYQRINLDSCTEAIRLETYLNWGNAELVARNLSGALEKLQQASELDPDNATTLITISICHRELDQLVEATMFAQKAWELDSSDTDIGIIYIMCLLDAGFLEQAATASSKMIKLSPLSPKAHYICAVVCQRQARPLMALNYAYTYLKFCPGDDIALDLYLSISNDLDRALGVSRGR